MEDSVKVVVMKRILPRIVLLLTLALLAAGCDKCGHRVNFNAPSLPDSCGDNADPAH